MDSKNTEAKRPQVMDYKETQLAQNRNQPKTVPSYPLWGDCQWRKIRASVILPCHFKLATCTTFIDLLSDAISPHWFRQSLIHTGNEVWLQKETPKKRISHRNLQKLTTGRNNWIKYRGKIHCKKKLNESYRTQRLHIDSWYTKLYKSDVVAAGHVVGLSPLSSSTFLCIFEEEDFY